MKYKVGEKVKINMTGIQCGDAFDFFIERLQNSTSTVERIFGSMYFLEDVPFILPEECLEEILNPIISRFEILDL